MKSKMGNIFCYGNSLSDTSNCVLFHVFHSADFSSLFFMWSEETVKTQASKRISTKFPVSNIFLINVDSFDPLIS